MTPFSPDDRDRVRDFIVGMTRADSRITGIAFVGSLAVDALDGWSDLDITCGVRSGVDPATLLDELTTRLGGELAMVDYFDVRRGNAIYRVMLFVNGLEVDLSLAPEQEFGQLGPRFRLVHGTAFERTEMLSPSVREPIGWGWHHTLHANGAIARGRPWQALFWINSLRDQLLTMMQMRHGLPSAQARGAHELPQKELEALQSSLPHTIDERELRRSLAAIVPAYLDEVGRHDSGLAARLAVVLDRMLGRSGPSSAEAKDRSIGTMGGTDPEEFDARSAWNVLAHDYEAARLRPTSLDTLIEYPAQLAFIGDVRGKRILDVGCGSGAKAIAFAVSGAIDVVGIDISDAFIEVASQSAPPRGVLFLQGDINTIADLEELRERRFDLITCLAVFGYARDPAAALRSLAAMLAPGGAIVLQSPSPLRFAVEKSERFGLPLGAAYRSHSVYSYRSGWNPDVILEHRTPLFSEMLNAIAAAGLYVSRCAEPEMSEESRRAHPTKASWWDSHGGVILYELRRR